MIAIFTYQGPWYLKNDENPEKMSKKRDFTFVNFPKHCKTMILESPLSMAPSKNSIGASKITYRVGTTFKFGIIHNW